MLVKWMKLPNKKITFESFLCGTPARDYINQYIPYEQQIKDAAEMIQNAEYVLIGAGAGMSTAAGAQYGGKFFEENFADFQYGTGCRKARCHLVHSLRNSGLRGKSGCGRSTFSAVQSDLITWQRKAAA